MARLVRSKVRALRARASGFHTMVRAGVGAKRVRIAVGATTLGTAAAMMLAVATGGTALAATNPYAVNATGAGLNLSLFGNELVGGNATACANYGTIGGAPLANVDGNGNPTYCGADAVPANMSSSLSATSPTAPEAFADGQGTLLTPSGLHGEQYAVDTAPGTSVAGAPAANDPPYNCSQLNSMGPQGQAGEFQLDLGISCGTAGASLDSGGDPTANAAGNVGHVGVLANGLLGNFLGASPSSTSNDCNAVQATLPQAIGALPGGLCEVLSNIPTVGTGLSQALQDLYDLTQGATNQALDTVSIEVGKATSSIDNESDGTVVAKATGSTLDVQLFPYAGCLGTWPAGTPDAGQSTTLVQCATEAAENATNLSADPLAAPLVEILVGPATCTMTLAPGANSWTAATDSSIVTVDVNIPGAAQSVEIPPGQPGSSIPQPLPLPSQLTSQIGNFTVAVASGSTSAPVGDSAGCKADSVTLNLFQGGPLPQSTVSGQGAVYASTGSTNAGANVSTAPPVTKAVSFTTTTTAATTAAAAVYPTSVHTGEWWSGSLPFIGILAGLGGGLLAWPRVRRIPAVDRIVHRSSR